MLEMQSLFLHEGISAGPGPLPSIQRGVDQYLSHQTLNTAGNRPVHRPNSSLGGALPSRSHFRSWIRPVRPVLWNFYGQNGLDVPFSNLMSYCQALKDCVTFLYGVFVVWVISKMGFRKFESLFVMHNIRNW